MDVTAQIDFIQEGRILKVQKNASKVLDNTVKKQFSKHVEWINQGEGWHPFQKKSALTALCVIGGGIAATLAPKSPHSCPTHCPELESSQTSSPSDSPTIKHKSSYNISMPSATTVLFVAAGVVGGALLWTKITEGTQEYQDWEEEKTYDELRQFIADAYSEHEILDDFQCPITSKLMFIPLKTPNGQYIDKDALKNIKQDNLGRYICPWGNAPFYKSELQIGYECGIKIAKCVRSAMREDDKALNTSSTTDSSNNPFPKIINLQNRYIDYLYRHAEGMFLPPGHNKTFKEQSRIREEIVARCGKQDEDLQHS